MASGLAGFLESPRELLAGGQDSDPKKLIEALSGEDIAERERAMEELRKTPLERLPLLEEGLRSQDAELQSRVKEAFLGALSGSLGRRVERFSLKSVATRGVMEEWTKGGSDPSKAPKGFEVFTNPDPGQIREEYDYLKRDKILLAPILSNEDIESINPKEYGFTNDRLWGLSCILTPKGAARFDEAAEILYHQKPSRGMMAIIVDGKILSTPVILSSKFGGRVTVPTKLATREKAVEVAEHIQGSWYELRFRIRPEKGSAPYLADLGQLVSGLPGFSEAKLAPGEGREARCGGTVDLRKATLIDLWLLLRSNGFGLISNNR
jgi:hypothetical protein